MKDIKYPDSHSIKIQRDSHGIIHIQADNNQDLYRGIGYCHAMDRGMQMLLMRILGKGEASQYLDDSDEMLNTDKFFRKMNWHNNLKDEVDKLTPFAQELCFSYCEGVNTYLEKHIPFEFKLLKYQPNFWNTEDCLLISRMTGYLTLAQSQGEMEHFIMQAIQKGISRSHLEEFFPGQLEGLDIPLLKKVALKPFVPEDIRWNCALSPMMASNNWVVSGKKTASGQTIMANDPHLEGNRLPNVWYELVIKNGERYAMGSTMPGLPGVLVGRTPDLAWGATYTYMDAIDSWVEDCRFGKYKRDEKWVEFKQREEVILRKSKPPIEVIFYENEHGVLEGDPYEEGYYLATRWSGSQSGARSLNHAVQMFDAKNVEEGMHHLGHIETAWNWVLADSSGNIGYQMSGLKPVRPDGISGLIPLPGWDSNNDWLGFEEVKNLPRSFNPPPGYFITANNNLNEYGNCQPINAPSPDYRARRIKDRLDSKEKLTIEDMKDIQQDTYSLQAQSIMNRIEDLLPEGYQTNLLKSWNFHYNLDSEAATVFENIYQEMLNEVFGKNGFGEDITHYLSAKTGIIGDFLLNFDRILLSENSHWFNNENPDDIFKRAIAKGISKPPQPWRTRQQLPLKHIILGGKLPKWARVDRGWFPVKGGRTTPHQGTIYYNGDRLTSFLPGLRIVTDFSEAAIHTSFLGGPSDRFYSKWYNSGTKEWLAGIYKRIEP